VEAGVDLQGDEVALKRIKLNEHKVAVPLPAKSAKNYIELNK
jgi:hypothetical protein